MAFSKLLPIVVSSLRGDNLTWTRILFHFKTSYCKISLKEFSIMISMRRPVVCALQGNFAWYSEHVPWILNDIPESLSRSQLRKCRQLVRDVGPISSICPRFEEIIIQRNKWPMEFSFDWCYKGTVYSLVWFIS